MLTKLYCQVQAYLDSKEGVTAIEYAIVAVAIAGIAAAVFGSDTGLKGALDAAMAKLKTQLT